MAQASKGADGSSSHRREKRDHREIVRLVAYGIGLVLLVAFIVRNSTPATVDFVLFRTHASLIWVILVSAVLGAVVDRLAIALGRRRRTRKQ
jgi:uncharacterized integral membrane protein